MAISPFRSFAAKLRVDGLVFRKQRKLGLRVINKTGSSIAADKLVAISGYDTTSKLPKIVLADLGNPSHTDIWVNLNRAIANNKEGHVYKGGLSAATLNTSSVGAAGDPVYLSGTAGAFTATANGQLVGYAITDSATVGQIHWDIQPRTPVDVVETVAATNAITAAESGKTFFLNHATEFDSTIPAPFAGGKYTFVVTGAPSGASYTITSAGANQIRGQVYTLDVNSATDPDFETDGANTITFVNAKAVAGDRVDLISDGTTWYAYGFCSVFDAITFTDV
jgi:uncharacterized protein DUF2190